MSITDDLDSDALILRLAGPLSPQARAAFRAAAEDALTRVPCWGEGAVYRAVAGLQKAFFDPDRSSISSFHLADLGGKAIDIEVSQSPFSQF
jgi:hypothetical protein